MLRMPHLLLSAHDSSGLTCGVMESKFLQLMNAACEEHFTDVDLACQSPQT